MTTYLLLYSGGKMPADEAEQKAIVADWMAWFTKLGSGLVDGGNPFTPAVKNVDSEGKSQ